jgi:hypothetical protein
MPGAVSDDPFAAKAAIPKGMTARGHAGIDAPPLAIPHQQRRQALKGALSSYICGQKGKIARQLRVTTTQRFFFHSFPRRTKGETRPDQLARGLRILRTIKEVGLVLAPEIVSWSQPTISERPRQITHRQQRLCFTELARGELTEHGKRFGPFSLQFSINTLRRLGALPVIYLPQNVKGDTGLSSAGAVIAATMGDIK